MRNVKRLRERFLRDPPNRRLANLASGPLRLGTWFRIRRDDTLTQEPYRTDRQQASGVRPLDSLIKRMLASRGTWGGGPSG